MSGRMRVCTQSGCPTLSPHPGRCDAHRLEVNRYRDRQRPSGGARGSTSRWQAFRLDYLARHPRCARVDCVQPATDIDHLRGHSRTCPHAFDEQHLMPLCHRHHSVKTAQVDGSFGRAPAAPRCGGGG